MKPEPFLTVGDTVAYRGGRGRPGTFSPHVSRPLAVRLFPFAIVPVSSPLPAPRMDSLSMRRRTEPSDHLRESPYPWPAVAPRAETLVRSVDDDSDDDTRSSVLASSVGAWTVGRGCAAGFLFFRLALPLPPPVTIMNPTPSADDSTVDR